MVPQQLLSVLQDPEPADPEARVMRLLTAKLALIELECRYRRPAPRDTTRVYAREAQRSPRIHRDPSRIAFIHWSTHSLQPLAA